MKKIITFIIGLSLISLLGTIELTPISYENIYKLPHFMRPISIIWPAIILTPFLIAYLLREKIRNSRMNYKSPFRLTIIVAIYLAGVLAVSAASTIFYYIGAAGYEYGERLIPSWIYALWGSVPTFLMLSGLSWLIFHFGLISPSTSEASND